MNEPVTIVSKKILIGFGEALAAPEVCFSLYDSGYTIIAFTRKINRCSLRFLPFVSLYEICSPENNVEATLDAMVTMTEEHSVDALMPLDDASLWLCAQLAREGRLPVYCKPVLPNLDAVSVALDKGRQVDLAAAAGLSVPETRVVQSSDDVSNWTLFPCIAKPLDAVALSKNNETGVTKLSKGEAATFTSQTELSNWLDKRISGSVFLLQPLVRGIGEGIFGHFSDNKVNFWSAHQRTRMMNPHGSGSSACRRLSVDSELKPKIEIFLRTINWSGYFMIEMLHQPDGENWFMELNGRAWGSMALARRSGLDYPLLMIESQLYPSKVHEMKSATHQGEVRNLGREFIHLLFVLKGPENQFYRKEWPGFLFSLAAVLKPSRLDGFYNYHPEFPTFFLKDGWQTVRNFLSK